MDPVGPEEVRIQAGRKTATYGANSLVLTLSVLACLIFGNILLSKYHKRWDVTERKIHSLSPQTLKILGELKTEVKVTAFLEDGPKNKSKTRDLLDEYAYRSKRLKVSYTDPERHPVETRQAGITQEGTVTFESGNRKKSVLPQEISGYGSINPMLGGEPEFKGENAFTNAILNVTSPGQKTIYFLTGHGERNPADSGGPKGYGALKEYLERDNYLVKTLNLITEKKVPADCAVLIVADPQKPLLDDEMKAIDTYLKGEGKALLLSDALARGNLPDLAKKYGISMGSNIVLDVRHSIQNNPFFFVPDFRSHKITEQLKSGNLGLIMLTARSVEIAKPEKSEYTYQELVASSAGQDSWAESNLKQKPLKFDQGKDIQGPVPIAVAVSLKGQAEKGGEEKSKLVVIGSAGFASNMATRLVANLDFAINSVNWLAEEKEKISIRPKGKEFDRLVIPTASMSFIFLITVVLVPGVFAAFGGWVWWKRRSL